MMTRFILVVAVVLAACGDDAPTSADSGGVDGGDAGGGDLPITPEYEGLAAAIEAERVANDVPGVAALMMIDGEVVFAHGFGTTRADGDQPVHASTLFRIGSVTKMLSTAVLLQSVSPGDVALDAPLTVPLPDFAFARDAAWAPSIRVSDLLTHQSGIVDYLQVDVPAAQQTDAALAAFLLGPFASTGYLMAPAGRMYNYSNPNFYLVGLLIERLTGLSYREAMRTRLLEPLAMRRTLFLGDDVVADGDFAYGRTGAGAQAVDVGPLDYDNAWARPAGYAWSSVFDLARFVTFLEDGAPTVLRDEERMAMQTRQVDTLEFGHLVGYGFGLIVQDGFFLADGFHAVRLVAHGGAIPGFAAEVTWQPERGFVFITLASADGATFTESLIYALEHYADLGAPTPPPDGLMPDVADLPRYVGTYQDDYNVGEMNVTESDGELRVSLPDVEAAGLPYEPVLVPLSAHNFGLEVQGTLLPVTFLFDSADADAPATYARTRVFVARRVPGARLTGAAGERRAIDGARLARQVAAPQPRGVIGAMPR